MVCLIAAALGKAAAAVAKIEGVADPNELLREVCTAAAQNNHEIQYDELKIGMPVGF